MNRRKQHIGGEKSYYGQAGEQSARPSDCLSAPDVHMQGSSFSVILMLLPLSFLYLPMAMAVNAVPEAAVI